jgi:hypothetical protein
MSLVMVAGIYITSLYQLSYRGYCVPLKGFEPLTYGLKGKLSCCEMPISRIDMVVGL